MPLYVGLMSGTSLDSIDAALVDINDSDIQLLHTLETSFKADLRSELMALCQPDSNEIDRLGSVHRRLGAALADAVNGLLADAGIPNEQITAIGSHGQTIRHRPPSATHASSDAFTLQIGDANTIVQQCGITTIADFRGRDIAAGGQGAPLAPAFHRAAFRHPELTRAVVNIGGMSNISLLPATNSEVSGYDCGPGNVLMDSWIRHRLGKPFDRDGEWASSGHCDQKLLDRLLQHPYFRLPAGPKSTGREDFNLDYLLAELAAGRPDTDADVQATLLELTARSIADAINSSTAKVDEIYICGGGAYNKALLARLEKLTAAPVDTTGSLGLDPEWVEAAAFAWLAHRCLNHLPGNCPAVTGASEEVILGAIYPAA